MKKKIGTAPPKAAKRRKGAAANRKTLAAKPRAGVPARRRRPLTAKAEIRRLRTQLAQALARIEQLEASADTDFLLEIPNRRGF